MSTARANGFPRIGGVGAVGAIPEVSDSAPYACRPTSRGSSRMNSATRPATPSATAAIKSTATRQPNPSTMAACSGKKMSWPVATLAAKTPVTRPRRRTNQRVATIAPSTRAIAPDPRPTNTPHSKTSCQADCMNVLRPTPTASVVRAVSMTRRTPKRVIRAPANGPHSPNSSRLTDRASDTVARSQLNSRSRGRTRTTRVAPIPADTIRARNVKPATIHA